MQQTTCSRQRVADNVQQTTFAEMSDAPHAVASLRPLLLLELLCVFALLFSGERLPTIGLVMGDKGRLSRVSTRSQPAARSTDRIAVDRWACHVRP